MAVLLTTTRQGGLEVLKRPVISSPVPPGLIRARRHFSPEAFPVEAVEEGVGEEVGQHGCGGQRVGVGGGGDLGGRQGTSATTTPRTETSARGGETKW